MKNTFSHLKNFLIYAALATFISAGVFSMGMQMETDTDGHVSGCVFMTEAGAMCPMNAQEHMTQWQQTFTAIPQSTGKVALIILAIIILASSKIFDYTERNIQHKRIQPERWRNDILQAINYFLILLSDGILNPKVYETVRY